MGGTSIESVILFRKRIVNNCRQNRTAMLGFSEAGFFSVVELETSDFSEVKIRSI